MNFLLPGSQSFRDRYCWCEWLLDDKKGAPWSQVRNCDYRLPKMFLKKVHNQYQCEPWSCCQIKHMDSFPKAFLTPLHRQDPRFSCSITVWSLLLIDVTFWIKYFSEEKEKPGNVAWGDAKKSISIQLDTCHEKYRGSSPSFSLVIFTGIHLL